MKTFVRIVVLCFLVPAGVALAQDKPAQEKPAVTAENPLTSWNKIAYTRVKGILVRSAEKMPEENYSFKPVDTVRRRVIAAPLRTMSALWGGDLTAAAQAIHHAIGGWSK